MTALKTALALVVAALLLGAVPLGAALADDKHRHKAPRHGHGYGQYDGRYGGPYDGRSYRAGRHGPDHEHRRRAQRHHGHDKHADRHRRGHRYYRGDPLAGLFGHGAPYPRRGYRVPAACHPVVRIGRHHGRKAKIAGTLCYDAFGRGYIVPGSRYVIAYLGY